MKKKNPKYRYYIRPHSFVAKRKVLYRYSKALRAFELFYSSFGKFEESFAVIMCGGVNKAFRNAKARPFFKPITAKQAKALFPEAFV
jgi:hypothetical protein